MRRCVRSSRPGKRFVSIARQTARSVVVGILVDPRHRVVVPIEEFLVVEEEGDLAFVRTFVLVVRAVDQVVAQIVTEISTNGSRLSVARVGRTHQPTDLPGGVCTLPDHREDGSRSDEFHETVEKRFVLVFGVVFVGEFLVDPHELPSDHLQALVFEPGDDLAGQSALDGVGLCHHERPLVVMAHSSSSSASDSRTISSPTLASASLSSTVDSCWSSPISVSVPPARRPSTSSSSSVSTVASSSPRSSSAPAGSSEREPVSPVAAATASASLSPGTVSISSVTVSSSSSGGSAATSSTSSGVPAWLSSIRWPSPVHSRSREARPRSALFSHFDEQ